MDSKVRVAIAGATGVVGREMLGALAERGHPASQVTLLGSARSEGEEVEYLDETLAIEKVEPDSFRGVQLALIATPEGPAKSLAQAAQAAGAWAVDVSPAFRGEKVPMVLPSVNGAALRAAFSGRVVRTPSPWATGLALALEPLRQRFGLEQVAATVLAGASVFGARGVDALEKETAGLLTGREPDETFFPQRLAFNVVPQLGDFDGEGTREERATVEELATLWGAATPTSVTAALVPTFYGVSFFVQAKLAKSVTADEVRAALKQGQAVKVLDAPGEKVYPMPMLVTADPAVHVGRVRAGQPSAGWVTLVAALDNAGRGAATTALEIAEALLERKA